MREYFTDAEHRILLAALSRERKVARELDNTDWDKDVLCLTDIVDSIERKVYLLQHPDEN